jgi:hypothetical protein
LKPSNIRDIARLLEESYDCIQPFGGQFKTTPGVFKDTPSRYLELILHEGRLGELLQKEAAKDEYQKLMDWAAWELSRSTLDQSMKDSVGLLLYADKMAKLENDPVRQLIPSFESRYISDFVVTQLYFCHYKAVMSGLCLGGLILRNGRMLARDTRAMPRWNCISPAWQEDRKWAVHKIPHHLVYEQYDSIQGNQVNWLPERSEALKELKRVRESITYRMEQMGGFRDHDTIEDFKGAIHDHILFQMSLLVPLHKVVEHGNWDRTFNPVKRTVPLMNRSLEYIQLAEAVLGRKLT